MKPLAGSVLTVSVVPGEVVLEVRSSIRDHVKVM